MTRNLIFIFSLLFCFSCGRPGGSFSDYVKHADSVSVAFFVNDSTTHIVIKDKNSIQKLGSYLDGEPVEHEKCSDTGSLWFYEGGKKKMQVDFSTNADCSFFSYMMNDKIFVKGMSEEAMAYLTEIKKIAEGTI